MEIPSFNQIPQATEKEPEITINEAKPEDTAELAAFIEQSWVNSYVNETYGLTPDDITGLGFTSEKGLTRRQEKLSDPTIRCWIAKHGDSIIGSAWAENMNQRKQTLSDQYTLIQNSKAEDWEPSSQNSLWNGLGERRKLYLMFLTKIRPPKISTQNLASKLIRQKNQLLRLSAKKKHSTKLKCSSIRNKPQLFNLNGSCYNRHYSLIKYRWHDIFG